MTMDKSGNTPLLSCLPHAPWNVLEQLTPIQLHSLNRIGMSYRLDKGDFVFHTGENADCVYFLKTGKIKVSHPVSNGKEITLWFCFGGDIFGLAEAAQNGEREVNARACEKSEILRITRDNFNGYLFDQPQVMFLLLQVISSRLRCLSETLANVAGEQVQTRFARLIVWLCTRYGSNDGDSISINVHLTHQEIAEMIGSTRQTITSIMSDFKEKGILATNGHYIQIMDRSLLGSLLH